MSDVFTTDYFKRLIGGDSTDSVKAMDTILKDLMAFMETINHDLNNFVGDLAQLSNKDLKIILDAARSALNSNASIHDRSGLHDFLKRLEMYISRMKEVEARLPIAFSHLPPHLQEAMRHRKITFVQEPDTVPIINGIGDIRNRMEVALTSMAFSFKPEGQGNSIALFRRALEELDDAVNEGVNFLKPLSGFRGKLDRASAGLRQAA